jgi:UDP-N-acetylmuramoyl-tripeptide--D-alanyl-D-alanine ligase
VTTALNFSLAEIKQGLEAFKPVTGRLQFKIGRHNMRIIDDTYNANPVSVKAALSVLAEYAPNTIFVMGDMLELGNDAAQSHQEIGQIAKELGIDHMLGIGAFTRQAIEAFGKTGTHYADKAMLIQALNQLIDSASERPITVLVKGSRGMRMEEVVHALTETTKETSRE